MHYKTTYSSPVGLLTLACDSFGDDGESRLIGLWSQGQKHFGESVPGPLEERDGVPVFDHAKAWLDRYFAGEEPAASELPLAPIGTPFRQGVWSILREIPYGEVITYGEIAQKMARRLNKASMSSQAVGGAVGHNPISIIIPCHRVVGANGSLTGYAGGVEMKSRLLELEGADMTGLFNPANG